MQIFMPVGARYLSRAKIHIFLIGDSTGGYRPKLLLESSRRANVAPYLTCNAAICRFRDIRGQILGLLGPLGYPQKWRLCVRDHIYHHAKFHADRCHRRRDICNRTDRYEDTITSDLVSDRFCAKRLEDSQCLTPV